MLTPWAPYLEFWAPLLSLVLAVLITYWDALKCGFVSDDFAGILFTDESKAKLYGGEFVRYKGDPSKKELLQPLWSFHNILRWLRFQIVKVPNPEPDWKKKNQPPFIASAKKHHRLNLIIFSGCACLVYLFLSQLFQKPIPYLASILFIIHPLGCQTVVWISGIGYLLSLLFTAAGLNYALLTRSWLSDPVLVFASVTLVGLFHFFAVQSNFASAGATLIFAWLGLWPHAIVSFLVTLGLSSPVLKEA